MDPAQQQLDLASCPQTGFRSTGQSEADPNAAELGEIESSAPTKLVVHDTFSAIVRGMLFSHENWFVIPRTSQ
jgi:hypothetical protein